MVAAQIESEEPGPFLNLAVESRKLFDPLSVELKELTGIDVEYVRSGIAAIAFNSERERNLRRRLAWQKKMGMESEWQTPEQIEKKFSFLKRSSFGGLWSPLDGQVSSNRLTLAFQEGAKKLGAHFFEHQIVRKPEDRKSKLESIQTDRTRFFADRFIFCAGPWMGEFFGDGIPVQPVKGQILIFQMPEKFQRDFGWEAPVFFGETAGPDPIHCYFTPKKDGHLFLGATSENKGFDKIENETSTERMLEFASEIFPSLSAFPFKGSWVGLRPAAPDRQPILGLMPGMDNVYVAGGHFRNGILLSPITGKIISELILNGKTSCPIEPFSPERFLQTSRSNPY